MTLELGKARIHYHTNWLVAYLLPQIPSPITGKSPWRETMDAYRALIPKAYYVQPQKYEPHITVIRLEKEDMPAPELWEQKLRHDEVVMFAYDTTPKQGGNYFFLNVWSPELMQLRVDLGLLPLREGYMNMHITIGNTKS